MANQPRKPKQSSLSKKLTAANKVRAQKAKAQTNKDVPPVNEVKPNEPLTQQQQMDLLNKLTDADMQAMFASKNAKNQQPNFQSQEVLNEPPQQIDGVEPQSPEGIGQSDTPPVQLFAPIQGELPQISLTPPPVGQATPQQAAPAGFTQQPQVNAGPSAPQVQTAAGISSDPNSLEAVVEALTEIKEFLRNELRDVIRDALEIDS